MIRIQHGSKELWLEQEVWLYMQCDLDLKDMTLREGQDTPQGHEQ